MELNDFFTFHLCLSTSFHTLFQMSQRLIMIGLCAIPAVSLTTSVAWAGGRLSGRIPNGQWSFPYKAHNYKISCNNRSKTDSLLGQSVMVGLCWPIFAEVGIKMCLAKRRNELTHTLSEYNPTEFEGLDVDISHRY